MENSSINTKNNNFNLLRFIFASLVILSHAPELKYGNRSNEILSKLFGTISFGELAVDSFFILSGFLILKSWKEKPNVKHFLTSRILRIYPGFIVASAICVYLIGPIYGTSNHLKNISLTTFLMSSLNLQINTNDIIFAGTPYPVVNGSLWSIPYEFKCYILVLLLGMMGILKKSWILPIIFIAFATIHIYNKIAIQKLPFDIYFRCGMAFSAGGCFYTYKDSIPWKPEIAIGSLLIFINLLFNKYVAEAALCIFFGYSIIYYATIEKSHFNFNELPDISYGVYLYAWPINKILYWHFPEINIYSAIIIIYFSSIISGILSSLAIEKPFMKIKKLVLM